MILHLTLPIGTGDLLWFSIALYALSRHSIQRAFNRQSWAIHHMRINHRRFHILMSQQLQNRANVCTILQQMRRKRMSQRMRNRVFITRRLL